MTTLGDIRELLRAPLRVDGAVPILGRAVWLYLWLLANASMSGHVCRTAGPIARELNVSEATIENWLARLEKARLVRIQSRPPYLVLKLAFWSGVAPKSAETALPHKGVPVSSSSSKQQQKKNMQASSSEEEGGLGEGEALIARLLRSLGQEHAAEVHELVRRHPEAMIEKALGRVQRTPPSHIRKSKLALFRYLVNRFTNNPDDPS